MDEKNVFTPEEILKSVKKNEDIAEMIFLHSPTDICHNLGIFLRKEDMKNMLTTPTETFLGAGFFGTVFSSNVSLKINGKDYEPDSYVVKDFRVGRISKFLVNPLSNFKDVKEKLRKYAQTSRYTHYDSYTELEFEMIKKINNIVDEDKSLMRFFIFIFEPQSIKNCALDAKRLKFYNETFPVKGNLTGKYQKFTKEDHICTDDFMIEILLSSYISHYVDSPFVAKALAFTTCYNDKNSINKFIIYEKMDNDLDNFVLNNGTRIRNLLFEREPNQKLDLKPIISESTLRDWLFMILFAVAQLQEIWIVHNDLKFKNILYKKFEDKLEIKNLSLKKIPDKKWTIKTNVLLKLADFGFSCKFRPHKIGLSEHLFEGMEFSKSYDVLYILTDFYGTFRESKVVQTLISSALGVKNSKIEIEKQIHLGFYERPKNYLVRETEETADPIKLLNHPIFHSYIQKS